MVQKSSYLDDWARVPDPEEYDNVFKARWELFLRHIVLDAPVPWNLLEGAKGVVLAELATQSWKERRWIEIPEIKV